MPSVTIRSKETSKDEARRLIREMFENYDPEESLREIIADLIAYEAEYNMSTVEFYPQFMAGKQGDSEDAMRWASLFEAYVELIQPLLPHHVE